MRDTKTWTEKIRENKWGYSAPIGLGEVVVRGGMVHLACRLEAMTFIEKLTIWWHPDSVMPVDAQLKVDVGGRAIVVPLPNPPRQPRDPVAISLPEPVFGFAGEPLIVSGRFRRKWADEGAADPGDSTPLKFSPMTSFVIGTAIGVVVDNHRTHELPMKEWEAMRRGARDVSRLTLDVPALYAALNEQRLQRDMTWRAVALEVGTSSSLFTRMAEGEAPSGVNLVSLLAWLGFPPIERFTTVET